MEPTQEQKPRKPRPIKCKSNTVWILNTASGVLGALALGVVATSSELRQALPEWQFMILLVVCNAVIQWVNNKKKDDK